MNNMIPRVKSNNQWITALIGVVNIYVIAAGGAATLQELPSHAYSINNSDEVVIVNSIWHQGITTEAPSGSRKITDEGVVFGYLGEQDPQEIFRWENGTRILVGTTPNSGATDYISGINSNGVVVSWGPSHSGYRGCTWSADDGVTIIDTLGGRDSYANAISNSGYVVGSSHVNSDLSSRHPFRYSPDGGMVDLGTLGGEPASAEAINEKGEIAGWSYDENGNKRAFLWNEENGIVSLGSMGDESEAHALNENGQVVGQFSWGSDPFNQETHAFIWDEEHGMIDLNSLVSDSGLTLFKATDINDNGSVIGYALDEDDNGTWFLMTGINIPEPNTFLALVVGGLTGFIASGRRSYSRQKREK